jgi:hypothetical protein
MTQNVRLQNLRDFTVQIRRVEDDSIVGTGIAVSTDGRIVTCAHVVEAALGAHPRNASAELVFTPKRAVGKKRNIVPLSRNVFRITMMISFCFK